MPVPPVRDALNELKDIVVGDNALADDDGLARRLAAIEIDVDALEATAARTNETSKRWHIIDLSAISLRERIASVGIDVLAYCALPDEPDGTNEPRLGMHRANLVSEYLDALAHDSAHVVAVKDELARFIARMNETCGDN